MPILLVALVLISGNFIESRKIDYLCEEISFVTSNCKIYSFFINNCFPWDIINCPEPIVIPSVGFCPCYICTRLHVTIAVGGCDVDRAPDQSHTASATVLATASTTLKDTTTEAVLPEVTDHVIITRHILRKCTFINNFI